MSLNLIGRPGGCGRTGEGELENKGLETATLKCPAKCNDGLAKAWPTSQPAPYSLRGSPAPPESSRTGTITLCYLIRKRGLRNAEKPPHHHTEKRKGEPGDSDNCPNVPCSCNISGPPIPMAALKDGSCRVSVFLHFPCRDSRPQDGAWTAMGEGRAWIVLSSPAWCSWLRSWSEVAWASWSTRLGASSWWSRPLQCRWSAAVLWLSLLDTWTRSINIVPTLRHWEVHGRKSISFFGSTVLGSARWMPCVITSASVVCPHLTFCQLSAQQFPDFRHYAS